MGRRAKRGLKRLVLAVIVPLLCAWGIFQWLAYTNRTVVRMMLGSGTDPAEVERQAERLATATMNEWSTHGGGPFALLMAAVLVRWIVNGFTLPLARAPCLTTRRLLLRRARGEDAAALHAILCDPRAMQYWDTPPHGSLAETRAWLDGWLAVPPEQSDDFVVERDGRVIGFLGSKRLPWISFQLAPGEWRKGYASEALVAFRDYIVERGVKIPSAVTDLRNAAARALLEGAGFEECHRSNLTHEATGETIEAVWLVFKPRGFTGTIEIRQDTPVQ